ncbi:MAG: heavy metal translocating P-type ATPase [Thermoplasmata archaeon]
MPNDPVCGMFVPETSDLFVERDGQKYYFCSQACMDKFLSPEAESGKIKRKMVVAWVFTIPIMIVQYGFAGIPFHDLIELLLSIPVMAYSGSLFYKGAYHSIRMHTGNMDLLVSMGTLTAFFFSAYLTFFNFYGSSVYFDAAVFIITLILTGNYIETVTKERANSSARKLETLLPDVAHKLAADGSEVEVKPDDIEIGDIILVKPGEIVSCDGTVVEGKSEVDQSVITGEQDPVLRIEGDVVVSGTKNLNGILKIRAEKPGKNSTINEVYRLIQSASMGRVKVQRIADVFSSIFIPVVLAVAFTSSLFWYFYLGFTGFNYPWEIAILVFVSVVVIACPCAIGLAGPITLLISSNISSQNGIIIKNSGSFDRLARATMIVFDKTGTLTMPDPVVEKVLPEQGISYEDIVSMAASVEQYSDHPIAKAVVSLSQDRRINLKTATDIKEIPGLGITGNVEGRKIQVSRSTRAGITGITISSDGQDMGHILLSYKIRDSAFTSISALKSMGKKVSMVTGDSEDQAKRIAQTLGIEDVHWGAMPSDKAGIIRRYQESGEYVVFVGDGINDSVALETADVGIAMGSGLDIARESGDIILLSNDLNHVVYSIIIGAKTISKVKQNIGWAIGYNTVLLPVAAGILVPFTGLYIYSLLPILAALAMGMSSTSVVLNSLRLNGKIRRSLTPYGWKASAKSGKTKASPAH